MASHKDDTAYRFGDLTRLAIGRPRPQLPDSSPQLPALPTSQPQEEQLNWAVETAWADFVARNDQHFIIVLESNDTWKTELYLDESSAREAWSRQTWGVHA